MPPLDQCNGITPTSLPATLLVQAARVRSPTVASCLKVWSPTHGVVQSCSFAQLADHMLGAALWLRDSTGLRDGDRLALLSHNSISYVAFSLGAMALGAASVHLNWHNPPATNEKLVSKLLPRLVLAAVPFHADAMALVTQPTVRLELFEAIVGAGGLPLPVSVEAAKELRASIAVLDTHRTAVILFTGGTTGTPKAVPHTHSNLLWLAARCAEVLPEMPETGACEERSGTIGFTPFFHVMGYVANFICNLHVGCCAFILANGATLTAPLLLHACRELRPAVLNTVPWVRARRLRACACPSNCTSADLRLASC